MELCSCSLSSRPEIERVLLSLATRRHKCQQRMALRVNTTGNVLVRNVGRDGAEAVDTTASVAVKRKFGETTYSLRATESTIKNIRALNGALVQMSKPLGENKWAGQLWQFLTPSSCQRFPARMLYMHRFVE